MVVNRQFFANTLIVVGFLALTSLFGEPGGAIDLKKLQKVNTSLGYEENSAVIAEVFKAGQIYKVPTSFPLVLSEPTFQKKTEEFNKITLKFECLPSFLPIVITYTYTTDDGLKNLGNVLSSKSLENMDLSALKYSGRFQVGERGLNDVFLFVRLLDVE